LAERIRRARVTFFIEPYVRLKDQLGEQATMFFLDQLAMRSGSKPCPTSASSSPNSECPGREPKISEIRSKSPSKSQKALNPQLDRDLTVRQTLYYSVLVDLDSSRSEKHFLPVATKGPVCRRDSKEL
jgi:hypothetical protein